MTQREVTFSQKIARRGEQTAFEYFISTRHHLFLFLQVISSFKTILKEKQPVFFTHIAFYSSGNSRRIGYIPKACTVTRRDAKILCMGNDTRCPSSANPAIVYCFYFCRKRALSKISKLIVFDIKILRRKHLIGAIITMFESSSDVI